MGCEELFCVYMLSTTKLRDTRQHAVSARGVRQMYQTSLELAELAEDLLEDLGEFQPDFLKKVKKSLQEYRQGKARKVHSVLELM